MVKANSSCPPLPSPSLCGIPSWEQQWEVTGGRLWFMCCRALLCGCGPVEAGKMDPRCDQRRQPDYSLLPLFIFIFNTRRFAHSLTHHVAFGEMKRRGVRSTSRWSKRRQGDGVSVLTREKLKTDWRGWRDLDRRKLLSVEAWNRFDPWSVSNRQAGVRLNKQLSHFVDNEVAADSFTPCMCMFEFSQLFQAKDQVFSVPKVPLTPETIWASPISKAIVKLLDFFREIFTVKPLIA